MPRTEPLDRLDKGARAQVYKNLADWVAGVLDVPEDRPERQRYELGITLRVRRNHWEHSFWLPPATPLQRPELDAPHPDDLFRMPYGLIDGENLFRLLFGSDPQKSGNILGAAFGIAPPVDPTRAPLRLRLVTNDARLWALPWGKIAYQGRRLAEVGWTVELHNASGPGVPEYPCIRVISPARWCCWAPTIICRLRKARRISPMWSIFFRVAGKRVWNPYGSIPHRVA